MAKDYERSDEGLPEGYVDSERKRIERDQQRREAEEAKTAAQPEDGEG